MASELKPTPETIDSVCLSYRHDFGLLDETSKRPIRSEALWWFEAWQKEGYFVNRPAPAAPVEGLERYMPEPMSLGGMVRDPDGGYVTRSQAEDLLAAEHEGKRFWQNEYTQKCKLLLKAEANNAAKDARIKELEESRDHWCNENRRNLKNGQDAAYKVEALEAKLAAAEKALELAANRLHRLSIETFTMSPDASEWAQEARAVLGGKP